MNLRKKIDAFFSKHIIASWMLSYIIIFIITFVNSIYTYAKTEGSIKQRIYENDSQMLDNIISIFDRSISDFSLTAVSMQNIDTVSDMMNMCGGSSEFDLNCINIAKALTKLYAYNSMPCDMYLYFNQSDTCISPYLISDRQSFFENEYDMTDTQLNEWSNHLTGMRHAAYMISHTDGSSYVDFFYSLPIGNSFPKATAVIRISNDFFDEIIKRYADLQNRSILIIDKNDKIVFGNSANMAVSYDDIPDGISYDKKTHSTIIAKTSVVNKWKYISVTPQSFISEQLRYLRSSVIISLVLSTLAVFLLAFYFTKKNYEPLANIVKKFNGSSSVKPEYELINDILNDYISNKQKLKSITYSTAVARKNKLLSGLATIGAVNRQEMENYGISFISDYFSVVCFNITNADRLFSNDENTPVRQDNDETAQIILVILTNIFEEIIGRNARGYVTEADGKPICIINFDDERLSIWYEDVSSAVAEAKRFIEENFHFSFNASISSMHKGINSISSAYWEANHALCYRSFIKNENLISFEDIQTGSPDNSANTELYRRLINFVKLGNYDVAQSIADSILSVENGGANYIYVIMIKIAADVSSAVFSDAESDKSVDYSSFLRCVDELISTGGDLSYQKKLSRLLKLACDICESRLQSRQYESCAHTPDSTQLSYDSLTENVKAYIQDNYSDCNLHLVSLGEHFDITPYYLSNIFKKEEGTALMDYIARLRIEKAKEYIDSLDISMSEIAEKVGFNNVRTFLRTFKKFEGITPSQYKELKRTL